MNIRRLSPDWLYCVSDRSPSRTDLYYAVETALIAPGIVSHEAAHLLACRLTGVEVLRASVLNPFAADAYLDHERVTSFPADLLIAVAPLLCNTPLAFAAFVLAPAVGTPLLSIPLYWLGVCFALTAFPSVGDTETLFQTAGDLPGPLRPVGYLLATPVRAFTAVPGSAGVAGFVLFLFLFGLTRP
ncbi:Putative zincin peptidase [Halorientalis persicus]|uniref:Putative zincin peptidase n=1 Tax=Halorientalis persicus TaxID=1367881 RepID=A0A1H8VCY5_9EURY|nr:Putative zincin peptidase [Halorientalis persicus]